jgi:hypothetical protein
MTGVEIGLCAGRGYFLFKGQVVGSSPIRLRPVAQGQSSCVTSFDWFSAGPLARHSVERRGPRRSSRRPRVCTRAARPAWPAVTRGVLGEHMEFAQVSVISPQCQVEWIPRTLQPSIHRFGVRVPGGPLPRPEGDPAGVRWIRLPAPTFERHRGRDDVRCQFGVTKAATRVEPAAVVRR